MRTADTQAFWSAYRRHEGLDHDRFRLAFFLVDRPLNARLVAATGSGLKRTLPTLRTCFGEATGRPVPAVGDHAVLIDHCRRPRLIWRITGVSVAPLSSVTEEFAWRTGPDGVSRETFLRGIRPIFARVAREGGCEMHDAVETVFETFEVVWPPAAARRARFLAPQLDRAFGLKRRLEAAEAALRDTAAILARVESAVITVGPDLRVRSANPAAEVLLRRGDGLRLREGVVGARLASDERALASAVAAAACQAEPRLGATASNSTDAMLTVWRGASDQPSYRVGVFALPHTRTSRAGCRAERTVLLLVDDPARVPMAPLAAQTLLARAFGLTGSEARLALQLGAGASLTEAAATLGITRNTARAHLRAVFGKTDVHRQVELVRLVQGIHSLRLSPSRGSQEL